MLDHDKDCKTEPDVWVWSGIIVADFPYVLVDLPHTLTGSDNVFAKVPYWIRIILFLWQNNYVGYSAPDFVQKWVNGLLQKMHHDDELCAAVMALIRLGASWEDVANAIESKSE